MDGEVDEIPVVGLLGILQIHRQDFIATANGGLIVGQPFRSQPFELRHKNQQSTETNLMPAAHQQRWDFAQREVLGNGTYHLARLWHFQAKKLIALTILTRSCLEEPHEDLSLRIILLRLHKFYNFTCCHHIDGKGTKKLEKYKRKA